MFITFEGIDGSGKSTQMRRFADYLRSTQERRVIVTREPGGSHIGNSIRRILLSSSGAFNGIHPMTEVFLFNAARIQHVTDLIKPALAEGCIVLCDRYVDSTIAYQVHGHGLDGRQVSYISAIAMDGFVPNVTFLFDVPVEEAQRRKANMGVNRMDTFPADFYQRVSDGYKKLAEETPYCWRIIDATKDADEIAGELIAHVDELYDYHDFEESIGRVFMLKDQVNKDQTWSLWKKLVK